MEKGEKILVLIILKTKTEEEEGEIFEKGKLLDIFFLVGHFFFSNKVERKLQRHNPS